MRLTTKLAFAVVFIMVAIFSYRAYDAAQRETARARADLREDHFIIGRALRPALMEVWRLEGQKRALEVLGYADERIQRARQVRIEWVPLAPPSPRHVNAIGPAEVAQMQRHVDATIVRISDGQLRTYIPFVHLGKLEGALEISEPLTPHEERSRAEVWAVLGRAAVGAAASIAAVSALGFLLVGRPMRRLTEMAKRIGTGDLDGTLHIRQRDELGELANEMNHMCGRLRDANDRVRQETAARIGALEQLRHVDRLRTVGTLASGIAHELGTPLNVVSGRAKMVASGEAVGPEAVDSARIIVEQVERITKIIRQLLDFARRRTPDRGRHALGPLVEQTLSLLRPMAGKRRVELRTETDEMNVHADLDLGQVQQALTNLVVNGLQAMPEGGQLSVSVSRRRSVPPTEIGGPVADFAVVTVSDRGVGILPELMPRVFEPFFTTKDVGEGTGLGLSVAYGIARDHGGWIAVDSEVGRGSSFSLFLPVTRSMEVPV